MTTKIIDESENHGPLALALGATTSVGLAGGVVDIGRVRRAKVEEEGIVKRFKQALDKQYVYGPDDPMHIDRPVAQNAEDILYNMRPFHKFDTPEKRDLVEELVKNKALQARANKGVNMKLGVAGLAGLGTGAAIIAHLHKEGAAKKEKEEDKQYGVKGALALGVGAGALGARDMVNQMTQHHKKGLALENEFGNVKKQLEKDRSILDSAVFVDLLSPESDADRVRNGEKKLQEIIDKIKHHDSRPHFKIERKTLGKMLGGIGMGGWGYYQLHKNQDKSQP